MQSYATTSQNSERSPFREGMTKSMSFVRELMIANSSEIDLIPWRHSEIDLVSLVNLESHYFICMTCALVLLANILLRMSQAFLEVLTFPNMVMMQY